MPKYDPKIVLEFMQMLGLLRKVLWISAPKCGANGFLMTQMPSTNFRESIDLGGGATM